MTAIVPSLYAIVLLLLLLLIPEEHVAFVLRPTTTTSSSHVQSRKGVYIMRLGMMNADYNSNQDFNSNNTNKDRKDINIWDTFQRKEEEEEDFDGDKNKNNNQNEDNFQWHADLQMAKNAILGAPIPLHLKKQRAQSVQDEFTQAMQQVTLEFQLLKLKLGSDGAVSEFLERIDKEDDRATRVASVETSADNQDLHDDYDNISRRQQRERRLPDNEHDDHDDIFQ